MSCNFPDCFDGDIALLLGMAFIGEKINGNQCVGRFVALPFCLAATVAIVAAMIVGTVVNIFSLLKHLFCCEGAGKVMWDLAGFVIRPIVLPLLLAGALVATMPVTVVALFAPDKIWSFFN
jgi:hypothetical protein